MGKAKSIFKKIKSIGANGLEPIAEGKYYLENRKGLREATAAARATVCGGCDQNVQEPIKFLKIEDPRIPELSGKMCDGCGCALPYLLRQNSKICKKW